MQQLALRHAVQHSLAGTFGVGDIVNVLPNDDVGIVRGTGQMKLARSTFKGLVDDVQRQTDATKFKILPHISGKRMDLVGDRLPWTMTTALVLVLVLVLVMSTGGVKSSI